VKVAVVGAGVVGLTCAYELTRAGAEVIVLDRGQIGHGASFGNTGWVCPSLCEPLPAPGVVGEGLRSALRRGGPLAIRPALDPSYLRWLWAFRRNCTRKQWLTGTRALLDLGRPTLDLLDDYRTAGVPFELHTEGLLLVSLDPKKAESYRKVFDDLRALGFTGGLRDVSGDEARQLEPALSERVAGGVLTELDGWVEPLSLTTGLASWLREHGADMRAAVDVLAASGRRVQTSAGDVEVDRCVVAAGADSSRLLRRLGVRVGVMPARGYSVTYDAEHAVRPRRALYLADARMAASTYESATRLAGVFELGWRDTGVDHRRLTAMLLTVDPFFAGWRASAAARAETWSGLRPVTSDGLPLIGRTPGDPGVFVATGHAMLGMTLAPATAALLAPVVLGEAASPVLAPFDPARATVVDLAADPLG
jgi:D-amino-acid dehydrogenase